MTRILLLLLLWLPVWPPAIQGTLQAARRGPLPVRIRAALNSSPAARTAYWGIQIADLASGKTLFRLNSDHFFLPASNTKIFTTALALTRLGPEYRTRTTVFQEGTDLVLRGGGDPNLSGRSFPYEMDTDRGDPLAAIESLADQIVAHGVHRVEGNVVGDDSAFVFEPYAEGWSIRDAIDEDGAPVSALAVNDNSIQLDVTPAGAEGAPAKISWSPSLAVFDLENEILTDSRVEKRVHVDREPGSRHVRLWGAVPLFDSVTSKTLAVDDPARFAALALMDALQRRGVVVNGTAVARHLYPGAYLSAAPANSVQIAERVSPALLDDLRLTAKVSQNLHAEMILRLVARERTGVGSRVAGLTELRQFLDEAKIDGDQYNLHDGSGLSRLNIVTPEAIVSLLRYMGLGELRENWMSVFAIGGVDGTLSARFNGKRVRGRIQAKTGSLTHVSALSGYLTRRDGRVLVFSILANNFNGTSSEIRGVTDRICSLLLE
ncbi:MAG: D-alanyl-D-alanine carboxypeptidase/D-alanyl-D-alanine-endopeptidase [Bryobacteraceae bacterium]|nr:D-alanyl-D-alanine carboxypeptidase/D-alanyl-D-alanine-endopeptidase [Acidobacteriota bacterium]